MKIEMAQLRGRVQTLWKGVFGIAYGDSVGRSLGPVTTVSNRTAPLFLLELNDRVGPSSSIAEAGERRM